MSSALAIASVTAVLKSLLDNRLVEQGAPASVGDVSVTALPPDRITTGADERSQLNLFLYRVTPEFAGSEETSRLWSALQARYRPSAAYKVSTILLEARAPAPPSPVPDKPVVRAGRR